MCFVLQAASDPDFKRSKLESEEEEEEEETDPDTPPARSRGQRPSVAPRPAVAVRSGDSARVTIQPHVAALQHHHDSDDEFGHEHHREETGVKELSAAKRQGQGARAGVPQ